METSNSKFLTTLRELLSSHFDREELRTLSFDLGIDYDDLRGEGKSNKARELIGLMARRQRLPELVEWARKYRPGVQWPSIPGHFAPEAIPGSQEIETASTPVSTGPTFNISGDIKAGQVNVGGVQAFTGPIDVDMRETTILGNVTQTINALPHGDDAQKAELVQLVNELQEQLARVPEERVKDAAKVSKRVEALAREIDSKDKEMIEIAGESLKRAAQDLKDVLPTVLTIATQIVANATRFVA